jgi:hypothetical protein
MYPRLQQPGTEAGLTCLNMKPESMTAFLPRTITHIALTAILSASTIYIGFDLAEKEIRLMPRLESGIAWVGSTQPPQATDQTSSQSELTRTTVLEEGEVIRYEFFLSSQQPYPYGSYDFTFLSKNHERHFVDLTAIES